MTHRRRNEPSRAPTALGDVLEGTRRAALKRAREAVDRETWLRVVGRRIAERTEVGALKGGELIVHVASAPWAQELSFLTPEIRARLAEVGVNVERIRFRVKSELPKSKAEPTPQPTRNHRAALPKELTNRLESISDEELRRAISGAAGLAIGRISSDETRPRGPAPSVKPRVAPAPRSAEARNAPTDRNSLADRGGSRRSRAKR